MNTQRHFAILASSGIALLHRPAPLTKAQRVAILTKYLYLRAAGMPRRDALVVAAGHVLDRTPERTTPRGELFLEQHRGHRR